MSKKFILQGLILVVLFFAGLLSNAQEFSYTDMRSANGITVNLSVPQFSMESLNYKGEEMQEISISAIILPNDAGLPNLPRVSRYIAIPQGATVRLSVKNVVTETVHDVNIAPALEIQAENEEPRMDYIKNEEVYKTNALYPSNPVEVSGITSVRGVDAVILGITPFQYNPVTKELVVYKNIELDLEFVGGNNHYGDDKYRSSWFDPILKNVFLNYQVLPEIDYSKRSRDGEGCEYLIVVPNDAAWLPYAEQIKDWRTKQGILTHIVSLADMGASSTAQIKAYLHNAYNNWDIPPVAVLLMADHGTNLNNYIPAESVSHSYSGSCITDNQYADVTGDKLPEMVFARMVASNTNELNILVSKVLEYESNPCMEENYYHKPITALGWQTERWFQLCSEVVGGYYRSKGKDPVRINCIYSGTPGSSWSSATNTNTVVNYFGPNGRDYIPSNPSTLGGWTGGTPQQIVNVLNGDGSFIVQHRDHGLEDGWGEPAFRSSHVSQLTNVGKMTYVFSINCLTGKFNLSSKCFAENFILRQYNGQNAGAVGILCPTEVSFSFVNDAYVWGVNDLFDPDFLPGFGPYAENSGNFLPAFGNVSGKYFLAQSSWPYNSGDKEITFQMFTAHSDAFLRIYTEVPQEMAVEHQSEVMTALPLIFTCTEGAMVALTLDGEILAVVEATGEEQQIELPIIEPGNEITIVATKQNYLRYESSVLVIAAEGPYMLVDDWTLDDENNNGSLEYFESATINLSLKNIGVAATSNLVATMTTEDEYITITNATANFGIVASDDIATISDAFEFQVAYDVPDNHVVEFYINMVDGTSSWSKDGSFSVAAPVVNFGSFGLQGDLVPGATVDVVVNFVNNGNATVYNPTAVITVNSNLATLITANPISFDDFGSGESSSSSFTITVDENAPFGEYIPVSIEMSADYDFEITTEMELLINICNVSISEYPFTEGFEAENMPNCWTQEYDENLVDWYLDDGGISHHPYNAYSGEQNIVFAGTNGVTTKLVSPVMNLENATTATLTFYHAQSAQSSNQDVLRVYYRVAANTEWILIEEYLTSSAVWKERVLELPETSSNYYIAFEGEANGGYGIVIDDVQIDADFTNTPPIANLVANYADEQTVLSWTAPENAPELTGYDIYCNNELIDNSETTSYTHTSVPYYNVVNYCIVATYSSGASSNPVCAAVETCMAPIDLLIEQEDNLLLLSWTAPADAEQFNIYKNNELLANNITENSFTDDNGYESGELFYQVTAVYPDFDCEESAAAEQYFNFIGIDGFAENNVSLYPNPANSNVFINGENIISINVYNSLGQIVKNIKKTNSSVNVADLSNGVYIFEVCTETDNIKFKIIVNH
ncbi:MAG: C25 family cysteine peptidase [Bacteroidales bacterium]|jgi:hypothetical protein|nr:C25 family cysteine peptidase [Bacteroidales bacterium]MDD3151661.1 C25 family cysteine peptidase [Bacteroidales bacterium]MDD3914656.1 C25 family cysteine peptidase [Bacteroidales bacterium]MDD4634497.1 C25 family cysteine peptidase [Bacteroidales bacterium]